MASPTGDQDTASIPRISIDIPDSHLERHDVSPLSSRVHMDYDYPENCQGHVGPTLLPNDEGGRQSAEQDASSSLLTSHSPSDVRAVAAGLKASSISVQDHDAARTHSKARRNTVFRLWWLEISACVLSFACFGSIFGVLMYEDGKPLSQWSFRINSKTEIGPTAVVSFLSTLGKSSFLLVITEAISQLKWLHFERAPHQLLDLALSDGASRGPLGSSWLVWKMRWHHGLASAAGLCVILSLVVDPFVQLVFAFPILTEPSELERATFRTTSVYNRNRTPLNVSHGLVSVGLLDYSMQSAILGDLYGFPMMQKVQYCSSGNCTFTNLKTLGICSRCSDLTSKVASNCSRLEAEPVLDDEGETLGYIMQECDYNLPMTDRESGGEFKGYVVKEKYGLWSSTRWSSTLSVDKIYGGESRMGQPATIVHIFAIQLLKLDTMEQSLHIGNAWTCSLSFCEKTFDTINVTQGIVTASDPSEKHLLIHGLTTNTLPNDATVLPQEKFTSLGTVNNTPPAYWINTIDYSAMQVYLLQLLTVGWWDDGLFKSTRGNLDSTNNLFGTTNLVTPDIGSSLAEEEDIPYVLKMVAANMTESLRIRGSGSVDGAVALHTGVANRTEAYIHVQWGYLALPFTLTAVSTVLLVMAIIMTERSDVPVWKSSGLALLFHSLAGYDLDEGIPTRASELEKIAQSFERRLSKDE